MQKIKNDWLRQFIPSQRFIKTDEIVIHHYHHSPSELSQHRIKVLSWNVAKNNDSDDWTREFIALLHQHNPDIICLQEVRLCAKTQKMKTLSDRSWNFAPNFMDTYHNAYAGILTAAWAHHQTGRSLVTQHAEPITQTPKVSLFTEYCLLPHDPLLIVNTHLINFVERSSFQAQLQAIETQIAMHTGAIIFSGDCNTWSFSRWLLLQQMAARLGLKQASFSFNDSLKIKRFLLSPPLDYIFYRGMHEYSTTVLNTCVASDHKPILAEFGRIKSAMER
jgi:endonuclease/exonuclease/phosphatase (EEP) superfamily protein YafD